MAKDLTTVGAARIPFSLKTVRMAQLGQIERFRR